MWTQCSQVKKLYDQNSHDWKLIRIRFIVNGFGKNFILDSNFSFKASVLHQILLFTQTFFNHGKETFLISPTPLVV